MKTVWHNGTIYTMEREGDKWKHYSRKTVKLLRLGHMRN